MNQRNMKQTGRQKFTEINFSNPRLNSAPIRFYMLGTDSNFASLSTLFPLGDFAAEEVASVFWCRSYLRLRKSKVLVKGQK